MTKKFRTADEVTRDVEERKREAFKKMFVNEINEVVENIFPQREKVKKKFSILKWLGILFLVLLLLTLILGMIWLLKFFISNIF